MAAGAISSRERALARWLAALLVVATALTVAPLTASPAVADTPVETFTPLPMVRYGDHLVDQDRGLMYLTGGTGDNRLFVLDAEGQVVHVVTDLPGATDLSLSPDGSRLFVGLSGAAAIAELDPTTWEEVHRWSVAPTAPDVGEIVFVDGSVWFSDGVDQWGDVYALDTATAGVAETGTMFSDPELAVDQLRGRVIVVDKSDDKASVYDAATHELLFEHRLDVEVNRLVVDGDTLLVGSYPGELRRYRLEDLRLQRTYGIGVVTMYGFSVHPPLAVAPTVNEHSVLISDLETGTRRTELVFPDESEIDVLDTAFVSGRLLVISTVGGWVRVYAVDDPAVESADLSFSVARDAIATRPMPVEGRLIDQGSGVGGAVVVITGPDGEAAEAVTQPDGSFHTTIVPSRAGRGAFTATYAGDADHPPAWARSWAIVDRAPASLEVHGASQTEPGEVVVHTGRLTFNGTPLAGEHLSVTSSCEDETVAVTTDADGRWTVAQPPPRCRRTDYTFHYGGNLEAGPTVVQLSTLTSWHTSNVDLAPTWTEALVDEPVDLTTTLSVDDRPAADRPVTLTVRDEDGAPVLTRDLVTDAHGRATTTFVPSQHGTYSVRSDFAGDDKTYAAVARGDVWVRRIDTSLILTGPRETPTQGPVVLRGRLTGDQDLPLAGRAITVSKRADGAFSPLATVETDADGRFTFEDSSPEVYGTSYRASFAGDRLLAGESATLDVVRRPVEARVELDVPDSASAGDVVRVTGRLVGAQDGLPIQRRPVRLSATSDSVRPETFTRILTTDMDGRFSVDVPMAVAATWTVEAAYTPEDPSIPGSITDARVAVFGYPGRLDLTPRPGWDVPPGQVVVDGLLRNSSGWTPAALTDILVRRTSPTGEQLELDPVRTATDGSFTFRDTPPSSGSWTYRFTSLPRTVETQVGDVTVEVKPPASSTVLTEALRPDRVARGYAVFRPAVDPVVRSTTTPAEAGRCVTFQVQRWRNDAWRAVDRTGCVSTSGAGIADHRLAGRHPERSRWRVRADVVRSDTATGATSAWTYLRFDRP